MIIFFCGTPGSGKSYDAVAKIMDNLRMGRVVCTNVDGMELQTCQEYIKHSLGWSDSRLKSQLRILTKSEIMRFWKTEPVTRTIYGDGDEFPDITETTEELICPHGALIVIDEVHKHYNARDWQATASRELGDWASTHRHMGYDLILITQSIEKVDKQVRTLTEWTYFYRKVNFLGSLVSNAYIKYSYSGDDHEGKALTNSKHTYSPDIFPCYKSYVSADAKEVGFMKHVNVLKHPVFFAIPAVICLCLYMFFQKSSFASGDIFGTKKVTARNDAAVTEMRKTSSVPPVLPARVAFKPVSSVVRPAAVWPVASASSQYSLYHVSGWINDNGHMIISFAGVNVHLPNPDVLKFNKTANTVMARTDVFGTPSSAPVHVPAPVQPVAAL
jgi:zona occludens toxin (predicted ATPase)